MGGFEIPSANRDGIAKAVALNPNLAALVENTVVDDPPVDAAVKALALLRLRDIERLMNAGKERDAKVLAEAPKAVRDFFESIERPPAWFGRDSVLTGRYAFYEHLDLFIVVSLRNFDSLMSRVFFMTGQATTQQGQRIIRQNTRYLVETLMLPGRLDPGGEGW